MLKEREDLFVCRQGPLWGTLSNMPRHVIHQGLTDKGHAEIENERRFLRLLEPTGYVPKVIDWNTEPDSLSIDGVMLPCLRVEDVGDNLVVTDEEEFRRHFIRMLWHFKKEGLIHGDLTGANIRVVNNVPKVIDWKESRMAHENSPDKRKEGDIFHAFAFLASLKDARRIGTRFFAMWKAILDSESGHWFLNSPPRWYDPGTYRGYIAACAAAAGFKVTGTDINPGSIEESNYLWGGMGIRFVYGDSINMGRIKQGEFNVASLLSVYPYMLEAHGDIACHDYIEGLIDNTNIFFFETQLFGDGPGPEEFKTTHDVEAWLYERGANSVEAILESDVGRETTRTLWKVTK